MRSSICFVSAEVAPFAKTGGLGDVAAALPAALRGQGHDVRVVMPLYGTIDREAIGAVPVEPIRNARLLLGPLTFSVWAARLPGTKVAVYLIDSPALFARPAIYTTDPDEGLRFAALARAAIEFCRHMGWGPDVFHCNDWHTGLLPLYLAARYRDQPLFARSRTVLTIHNIGYQGPFGTNLLPALGLSGHAELFDPADLAAGRVNFLKTGILHADALTTVSPTHALEIQTPRMGMGLDGLLAARADRLTGILNGVDTGEWDPATDRHLAQRYTPADLTGKAANREALLAEMGLAPEPAGPVFGLVSRLAGQKGIELVVEVLPELLASVDCRVVMLGSGEPRLEAALGRMQARFPDRAAFRGGFSDELAHQIEAGADVFLMPSLYEPCGLNQMYSQRYGTPPIVRRTGGLADSVRPFDPATGDGTGFVFDPPSAAGLRRAIDRALAVWAEPERWQRLVANGMAADFSWRASAGRYGEVYRSVARRPARRSRGGL